MNYKRSIPFFNYPALFKAQETEIMDTLHDVMSRGAYILQRDLEEFEENIKELIGVKHVLGVADGTNALMLALRAADIGAAPVKWPSPQRNGLRISRGENLTGQRDEVIMSSHTYIATAASAYFVGATPVLVECGADHMIDPESVERAVTKPGL